MGHRVLLYVEDEDAAAFLMETALKEAHLDVEMHRVIDGEQALAFISHAVGYEEVPNPDLILLDLNMPRKSGLEFLAEMREAEELADIPVVVFTSSALPRDRRRSMQLGAREFITKPQTFEGLVAAVKIACSRLDDARAAGA